MAAPKDDLSFKSFKEPYTLNIGSTERRIIVRTFTEPYTLNIDGGMKRNNNTGGYHSSFKKRCFR
jgi:hypothetical protein